MLASTKRTSTLCKLSLCAAFAFSIAALPKSASAQFAGFQLNRYEPTAAGEWSFAVDRPWYSSTRFFAAGLTLNYGHNPLVYGRSTPDLDFQRTQVVVSDQVLGHIDLAGSFLDRVTLTGTLPVTLWEGGTDMPIAGARAAQGAYVGDPRFGALVRLYGHADQGKISLHLGANVWVPLRKFTDSLPATGSDQQVRVTPRIIAAGLISKVRWSAVLGFMYRGDAVIGNATTSVGSLVGPEVQLGLAAGYWDSVRRFQVGPEILISSSLSDNFFRRDFTSLEFLLGGHYNVKNQVQLGLALGTGVLRTPGTPDLRLLFRIAYAPTRVKETLPPPPPKVVVSDRDGDGLVDGDDLCPDEHKSDRPDEKLPGCPIRDRDMDGVQDREDLCVDVPQGKNPDPQRMGCPLLDKDNDGVADRDDLCVDVHMGPNPDPTRKGCPAGDKDKDGVFDHEDLCPDVPKGLKADPQRKGCPLPDRDNDTVLDKVDACPDTPGAPHPDPKKNGCPGLVQVSDGKLVIIKPVFFATDKDVILAKSFPVLQSVADALIASTEIKNILIEGHTDDRGKRDHNVDLSDRRARSVMRWLSEHGVDKARLDAKGFGPDRPIADNKTKEGRAKNRRVDFVIKDGDSANPGQVKVIKEDAAPGEIVDKSTPDQKADQKADRKKRRRDKKKAE